MRGSVNHTIVDAEFFTALVKAHWEMRDKDGNRLLYDTKFVFAASDKFSPQCFWGVQIGDVAYWNEYPCPDVELIGKQGRFHHDNIRQIEWEEIEKPPQVLRDKINQHWVKMNAEAVIRHVDVKS